MRPGRSARKQLRRAARDQLERAREAARDDRGDVAERVHEIRTSLKRARALLRMAGPVMPRKWRRAENLELRSLARELAELRDGEVRPATLAFALRSADPELRAACSALGDALERDRAHVSDALARGDTFTLLAERLGRAERRARRWRIGARGWRAIGRGLARGVKRARTALARAYDDGSDDAFHELRKAVKSHAQQIRFLEPLSPSLRARRDELDAVADGLGRDHDLAVLRTRVGQDALAPRRLADHVASLQASLRAQLRPRLDDLFAERPRRLERRVRRLWRAARRVQQPPERSIGEAFLRPR